MGWRGDSSKGDWIPASEADAVDPSHMLTIPSAGLTSESKC